MKRLALFLVLMLALSASADYTTNVTVIETIDSPAIDTANSSNQTSM